MRRLLARAFDGPVREGQALMSEGAPLGWHSENARVVALEQVRRESGKASAANASEAVKAHGGVSQAARALGVPRTTLWPQTLLEIPVLPSLRGFLPGPLLRLCLDVRGR